MEHGKAGDKVNGESSVMLLSFALDRIGNSGADLLERMHDARQTSRFIEKSVLQRSNGGVQEQSRKTIVAV
jgi:hypothetical protein